MKQKKRLDDKYLEKIRRSLQKELRTQGIVEVKTDYRIKHIYSLYKKLLKSDMDIDKIHDIVALRVVVPNIEDCYQVLGIIHNAWKPLPGRIKDYISTPKPNGYKSLHTTIFTGDGGIVEIQIRTTKMHLEAEYGIASHIAYKEETLDRVRKNKKSFPVISKIRAHALKNPVLKKKLQWVGQLINWQKDVFESGEFLTDIKMDFFKDRVFVFTPKGDVIDLPEDSTPVDFAFAVHSDIGNHMSGAKINGKLVSLNTCLKNGDIVEIDTKEKAHPSTKWLDNAKTTLAQRNIRTTLQKEQEGES